MDNPKEYLPSWQWKIRGSSLQQLDKSPENTHEQCAHQPDTIKSISFKHPNAQKTVLVAPFSFKNRHGVGADVVREGVEEVVVIEDNSKTEIATPTDAALPKKSDTTPKQSEMLNKPDTTNNSDTAIRLQHLYQSGKDTPRDIEYWSSFVSDLSARRTRLNELKNIMGLYTGHANPLFREGSETASVPVPNIDRTLIGRHCTTHNEDHSLPISPQFMADRQRIDKALGDEAASHIRTVALKSMSCRTTQTLLKLSYVQAVHRSINSQSFVFKNDLQLLGTRPIFFVVAAAKLERQLEGLRAAQRQLCARRAALQREIGQQMEYNQAAMEVQEAASASAVRVTEGVQEKMDIGGRLLAGREEVVARVAVLMRWFEYVVECVSRMEDKGNADQSGTDQADTSLENTSQSSTGQTNTSQSGLDQINISQLSMGQVHTPSRFAMHLKQVFTALLHTHTADKPTYLAISDTAVLALLRRCQIVETAPGQADLVRLRSFGQKKGAIEVEREGQESGDGFESE